MMNASKKGKEKERQTEREMERKRKRGFFREYENEHTIVRV